MTVPPAWSLDDVDYPLPPDRIAQQPVEPRDAARLLVATRDGEVRRHARVRDLPEWLAPGDLVVVNATRVRRARLRGAKDTGGRAEALLLDGPDAQGTVGALVKCRGRLRVGNGFVFTRDREARTARITELCDDGSVRLAFEDSGDPHELGEMPLPPYITRDAADPADAERYQTVFGREIGSVAAPTAGLHVTPELMQRLEARGIGWAEVVLHVGAGTFRPLDDEMLARGELHPEGFELSPETVARIEATRDAGGRIVAIGTTTVRVLESCTGEDGRLAPASGETRLFLHPGHARFRIVDALLTNFHLPRSSLLLLVAAFTSIDVVQSLYREAIAEAYRFYSYGDAMLLLP